MGFLSHVEVCEDIGEPSYLENGDRYAGEMKTNQTNFHWETFKGFWEGKRIIQSVVSG